MASRRSSFGKTYKEEDIVAPVNKHTLPLQGTWDQWLYHACDDGNDGGCGLICGSHHKDCKYLVKYLLEREV